MKTVALTSRRGFTLIELLVVISIIALLSSIAFTSLNSARAKAGNAARLALIKQYETALASYYSDNGDYPQVGNGVPVCLGNSPGGCQNGRFVNSSALQTALAPHINSDAVPPQNLSYPNVSGLVYFNCPFFGTCTQNGYGIFWYMDGANQSCAPGTVFQNFTLATSCMLFR